MIPGERPDFNVFFKYTEKHNLPVKGGISESCGGLRQVDKS